MKISHILLPIIVCFWYTSMNAQFGQSASTKAIVIGISEYQDEGIPDLEFAHRDAQAFADYLFQIHPLAAKEGYITLLRNETASGGQVHNALNNLLENSKTNDQIIIYFSGHGDVETISDVEEGHLLLHDTPSNNYQVNSLRISDLKNVIQKLTIEIGAHVLLIVDACRSGHLAGEIINGSQATAAALAQQFAKETKILSCQPNEISLEGVQWGGGRGLFSYHLIEGLAGLADNNNDLQITVREIQRYLEDWVEEDAKPQVQSPLVMGDRNKIVAGVDRDEFHKLINYKSSDASSSVEVISAIVEKGISAGLSDVSNLIDSFYYALDQEYYLPEDRGNSSIRMVGKSALEFYHKILESGIPEIQVRGAKGDFVAALQDGAQQAINAYLKSDNDELLERDINMGNQYSLYPIYLEKAVELVGPRHYLYSQLLAKQYYFQSVCMRIKNEFEKNSPEVYMEAKQLVLQALFYEDRAAYLYNELGLLNSLLKDDDAIAMYEKASELSPSWARAYCNLANQYYNKKDFIKAERMALKGVSLDQAYNVGADILSRISEQLEGPQKREEILLNFISQNGPDYYIYHRLGDYYESQNDVETAIKYFSLSNETAPNYYAHISLAYFTPKDQLEKIRHHYMKALELRPNSSDIYNNLGWLYYNSYHDFEEAKGYYIKALEIRPMMLFPNSNLGKIYFEYQDLEKSEFYFSRIVNSIDKENPEAYYYLSQIAALGGDHQKALDKLKNAIEFGFNDKEELLNNSSYSSLKNNARFVELLSSLK